MQSAYSPRYMHLSVYFQYTSNIHSGNDHTCVANGEGERDMVEKLFRIGAELFVGELNPLLSFLMNFRGIGNEAIFFQYEHTDYNGFNCL